MNAPCGSGLNAPRARRQRGADRRRRIFPRHDVDDRHAMLHRRAIRFAGDGHQTRFRLSDEVVTGTMWLMGEATDGAPDERGMIGYQLVGIEAASREGARQEVVDHDIGLGDEGTRELGVGRRGEVEGDSLLVSIDREVVRALAPLVERRPPGTGVVAGTRSFDLDDVRAQVGQSHGAEWAGEDS